MCAQKCSSDLFKKNDPIHSPKSKASSKNDIFWSKFYSSFILFSKEFLFRDFNEPSLRKTFSNSKEILFFNKYLQFPSYLLPNFKIRSGSPIRETWINLLWFSQSIFFFVNIVIFAAFYPIPFNENLTLSNLLYLRLLLALIGNQSKKWDWFFWWFEKKNPQFYGSKWMAFLVYQNYYLTAAAAVLASPAAIVFTRQFVMFFSRSEFWRNCKLKSYTCIKTLLCNLTRVFQFEIW